MVLKQALTIREHLEKREFLPGRSTWRTRLRGTNGGCPEIEEMKQEDFEKELYAKSRMNSLQQGWEKKDRMRGSRYNYVIFGVMFLSTAYGHSSVSTYEYYSSNRLRHPNGIWSALEKVELKNARLVLCWEITLASWMPRYRFRPLPHSYTSC